jgi:predicted RNA-binding protein YlqC (UPF0109 family)
MQTFLEYVLKNLVDDPTAVSVVRSQLNGRSLFEIRVGPGDMGKVVGKQGQTIDAIRNLAAAAASKYGEPCEIELLEDRSPQIPRPSASPASDH